VNAIAESQTALSGVLVDYHLDRGNGLDAIAELRRRLGADARRERMRPVRRRFLLGSI
jgi:ActR/RegA family two-component response regulator